MHAMLICYPARNARFCRAASTPIQYTLRNRSRTDAASIIPPRSSDRMATRCLVVIIERNGEPTINP
jgi:hypothetical protein